MNNIFYTDSNIKVVLFSGLSLGLYNMYYFYKNFVLRQSEVEEFNPSSVIKGILYPLFTYSLLKQANKGNTYPLVPELLTLLLIVFVFSGGLFSGWAKYLTFASFVPLAAINQMFKIAKK